MAEAIMNNGKVVRRQLVSATTKSGVSTDAASAAISAAPKVTLSLLGDQRIGNDGRYTFTVGRKDTAGFDVLILNDKVRIGFLNVTGTGLWLSNNILTVDGLQAYTIASGKTQILTVSVPYFEWASGIGFVEVPYFTTSIAGQDPASAFYGLGFTADDKYLQQLSATMDPSIKFTASQLLHNNPVSSADPAIVSLHNFLAGSNGVKAANSPGAALVTLPGISSSIHPDVFTLAYPSTTSIKSVTATSTTTAQSISLAPTHRLTKTQKIGLGVGVGIGIPLFLAIIAACIFLRRRKAHNRTRSTIYSNKDPDLDIKNRSDPSMLPIAAQFIKQNIPPAPPPKTDLRYIPLRSALGAEEPVERQEEEGGRESVAREVAEGPAAESVEDERRSLGEELQRGAGVRLQRMRDPVVAALIDGSMTEEQILELEREEQALSEAIRQRQLRR